MVFEKHSMESQEWMLLVRLGTRTQNRADEGHCRCFNAFSRVDVRVDVKIPGGLHAYGIALRGERYSKSSIFRTRVIWVLSTETPQRVNSGKKPPFLRCY